MRLSMGLKLKKKKAHRFKGDIKTSKDLLSSPHSKSFNFQCVAHVHLEKSPKSLPTKMLVLFRCGVLGFRIVFISFLSS